MKAKDNSSLPVDKENLLGKDKIPISSEKNGFVGYLEVPRYPNDKYFK